MGLYFLIMEKPVFEVGQDVYLEKGFPVWAQIAEKYVYANKPFSEKLTAGRVILGTLYTTDKIVKRNIKEEANHIANEIWKVFWPYYYEVDFKACKKFVESQIDVKKKLECTEFMLSEGIFTVTEIIYHPASTGHDWWPEFYTYKAIRKSGEVEIEFNNNEYYNYK